MNDRELLKLAAKAAGYCAKGWVNNDLVVCNIDSPSEYYDHFRWGPLNDDGDALRLAVKLNLHIAIDAESAGAITVEWDFNEGGGSEQSVEERTPIGGDDYAATRRAIVRAAAEIGRNMEDAE